MSQQTKRAYEFRENLPLRPIAPGTNVLLTGPSFGGTRKLIAQLLTVGPTEGMLFISTDRSSNEVIEQYEKWGTAYDPNRMAVLDCTQTGEDDAAQNVCAVSNPGDLTGIGMNFSSIYEKLYQTDITQIRTGLYNLSPLLMYARDMRLIYRFLHTMTGRVRTADGLGIWALDPETQDKKSMRSISQPFDGRISIRRTDGDGYQLKVDGLTDQPDGWQEFELVAQT